MITDSDRPCSSDNVDDARSSASSESTAGADGRGSPRWQTAGRMSAAFTEAEPGCSIIEHLNEMACAIVNYTGRHGITRLSLTTEVGLMLGIAPGTSIDIATAAGRVEVYCERWPLPTGESASFEAVLLRPDLGVGHVPAVSDRCGGHGTDPQQRAGARDQDERWLRESEGGTKFPRRDVDRDALVGLGDFIPGGGK